MSRPGYVDKRGNARDRAARRTWILENFDPDLGPSEARCAMRFAVDCPGIVNAETLSVDRWPDMGGSYRRGNIRPGCKPCQDRQGGLAAVELNAAMIGEYRDQRDAREALRESGLSASGVAGAAHSDVAYYQLSAEEFDQLHPPVLFKDWLLNREQRPDDESETW